MSRPSTGRRRAAPLALVPLALVMAACTTSSHDGVASPTATPDGTAIAATTTPSPSVSWPTALTEADAMIAPDPYSVVWLAVAASDQVGSLDAVRLQAEALGYGSAATPVSCVPPPPDGVVASAGDDAWGAPVYFAEPADAETFAEQWETPVVAVVHGVHLACDWG